MEKKTKKKIVYWIAFLLTIGLTFLNIQLGLFAIIGYVYGHTYSKG